MDGELCKSASIANKVIDAIDRFSYEMMFPYDLPKYNAENKLMQRELPEWMQAISRLEKRLVGATLCPADLVKTKGLPGLELTGN